MMQTSVIGFPRIGTLRELKFASEKYFRKEIEAEELQQIAETLRKTHWKMCIRDRAYTAWQRLQGIAYGQKHRVEHENKRRNISIWTVFPGHLSGGTVP